MNKDEWFVIKDLDMFIDHTRKIIYNAYGKQEEDQDTESDDIIVLTTKEKEELNKILPLNESSMIIKSLMKHQKNKKTKERRLLINDTIYAKIIQSLGDRMTSNILNGLVNKGVIETGYDNDIDDFIFWVKDEYKKEKPETD
jgi:hypothetical protein